MPTSGPPSLGAACRVLAERAARAAGAILLERWRIEPVDLGIKSSRTDPVSEADRAAERAIVELLRAERPDDSLVAEEGSTATGGSGVRWVIDPLDGTVNYLYGIPQWAVSVAALDAEGALAGVVYDPVRDEMFAAARGAGAWLGGRRLRVSAVASPAETLLATGFSYLPEERAEQARREYGLVAEVRDVRRFGAAALDLAWVAAGRIDGYAETVGSEWDWAAGALIVREAGGRTSAIRGVRPGVDGILASGPALHDALKRLIARVQDAGDRLDSKHGHRPEG
ncbi:MAG: inositol monophosphatase family protein [Candidatus Limnocylindria bacterium]